MICIGGRGGVNLTNVHQNFRFNDATFPTRAPISFTAVVSAATRVFAWITG